jgi:hypothetical protein
MRKYLPFVLLVATSPAFAGATVNTIKLDGERNCFAIPDFDVEICFTDSGLLQQVVAASGNFSFTVNIESDVEIYEGGVLVESIHAEETGHGLAKADSPFWFQVHDDFCQDSDSGFGVTIFVNVANGEVKHEVFELGPDAGC